MNRYILADIKRIYKKVSHWVWFGIMLLYVISCTVGANIVSAADIVDDLKMSFTYAAVPFGVLALFYVYGDDFKAKTSQIAIGIGISRRKVVIAKWLESVLLMALDSVAMIVVTIIINLIFGSFHPSFVGWMQVLGVVLVALIQTGAYMSIIMIITYAARGTAVSLLIYVLVSCGWINKGINYLGFFNWARALHIPQMTMTNLATICRSRMILGNFAPLQWIGLIIYIAIGIFVSVVIFERQELEF